jgi:hypothetical protein
MDDPLFTLSEGGDGAAGFVCEHHSFRENKSI